MSITSKGCKVHRCRQRIATIKSPDDEEIRLNYLECLNPPSLDKKGTILLIHGFPQTSYQFRHVIIPLSNAGYHIIAPDYRGAGQSSKPASGFTKAIMAGDILIPVRDYLGIKEKIHVVGHDIGGMIAFAYASRYPDHVASVIWGECPLPGSSFYEQSKGTVALFHFIFHSVLDLPEALVAGREGIYLKHFFDKLSYNSAAISLTDLEYYTTCYSQPGAMRCGINVYRAFEKDVEENRKWLKENGKCKIPALALSGGNCFLAQHAESMLKEFHVHVENATVADSGHYIAEENPEDFVHEVLEFVRKNN
ncbi:alpha/beta-hydrolase [Glonium stellatum]|uniref:Alpha/beta-hydrolase n=1 Tax=Glonium stellatum TaxID=574774 RepID=A0A8E2JPI6_9PEZI|nr:alpha/beta-hydrolase [Glonium stellatum]